MPISRKYKHGDMVVSIHSNGNEGIEFEKILHSYNVVSPRLMRQYKSALESALHVCGDKPFVILQSGGQVLWALEGEVRFPTAAEWVLYGKSKI